MRRAFAPVGTRLRKAAATEDGGDVRFGFPHSGRMPFLDFATPRR